MWPLVLDACQGQKNPWRVILIFPLAMSQPAFVLPWGRVCPSLLAFLSHTHCPDTMLIYYSIIKVIGCAPGLLPSG